MLCARADVDVNTEPLRWPIAPDGYIPNSVIRSWSNGGKALTNADCWDDSVYYYNLHQDEPDYVSHEDAEARILWLFQEEEEEKTEDVTEQKKDEETEEDKTGWEKEGGKIERRVQITEVKRIDVKKDTGDDRRGRPILFRPSSNIQPEQAKPSPDGDLQGEPQEEDAFLKYGSRNAGLR